MTLFAQLRATANVPLGERAFRRFLSRKLAEKLTHAEGPVRYAIVLTGTGYEITAFSGPDAAQFAAVRRSLRKQGLVLPG